MQSIALFLQNKLLLNAYLREFEDLNLCNSAKICSHHQLLKQNDGKNNFYSWKTVQKF